MAGEKALKIEDLRNLGRVMKAPLSDPLHCAAGIF